MPTCVRRTRRISWRGCSPKGDAWPWPVYNSIGVPVAAGVLYPFFGILLSPLIAAAAMSLSSFSVVSNALRLRAA
jgi:hypothetical protein